MSTTPAFPIANGAMSAAIRGHAWAGTLGPLSAWPVSLRVTANLMLATGNPCCLAWGPDLTLLYNDAFRQVLGKKHPGALGEPLAEVFSELWTDVGPLIADAMSGKPVVHRDLALQIERGDHAEEVSFTFSYSALHDDSDSVAGFYCSVFETTSQVREQMVLRADEVQFRTFAQNSPSHLWRARPDGYLDWFADQMYDYFQVKIGALDGDKWGGVVHPDDLADVGAEWARCLASGEPYQVEMRLRGGDGFYRYFLVGAVPVRDAAGEITMWVGSNTDIEQQKRQAIELAHLNARLEEQVAEQTAGREMLWRNSQDIQVIIDGAGVFQAVNPAFTMILGWEPVDVIGKPVFDFVVPDDEALTDQALQRARGAALPVVENRYRHKDAGFRWISWVAAPSEGLIYASGRHITAEKEQSAALNQAEQALRQAQKMEAVGQLTGGLAHDFNNLLAGMMGNLELLQLRVARGRLEDLDRFINAAQGAGRRAASLTQRLLAFSRRQTLDPRPTDVNKLITGLEDMLRRTVGATAGIEIVGAAGLWTAAIDAGQLENAILNLCINGRDAMPDGGRLTVETANKWVDDRTGQERDLDPGQYISICVTDTGTGMSPETIARAFEPFYTTKPIGQGTGLGLSMIYGFARQSGGQVRIYSEVGQGTTVCIYLPRHHGDAHINDEHAATLLPVSDSAHTVLVIDDEATIRHVIDEVLDDLGYTVIGAADGAAGIKVLQSGARIELLITDVGLPNGMNGRQVADEALRLRPGLKVLFITGFAENAAVGNGHLEPGMELLTKPFTLEALTTKVADMLKKPQVITTR